MSEDTIAAIATAPGEAGIGIVRISGKEAVHIADKVFEGKRIKSLSEAEQRKLVYGHIKDPKSGKVIDEVLVVYMKAPYTYTTEDVVEINCHGGMIPVRRILELILEQGARIAERGEFTKRAFLNGRIDLVQAEAVMDLISAKTDTSFDVSLNQLEGNLSKEVRTIRQDVLGIVAHIEASIDFPEDDVEDFAHKDIQEKSQDVLNRIESLLETVHTGKILREGLKTVILGKPNVGKSSLMNSILRENRAIVTEVPGTTRDVIEEYVNINGIPLKIIDTAGIRETDDVVEKIGVERAKELVGRSDLVIAVFDVSRALTNEDLEIIKLIKDKQAIILLNKTDLQQEVEERDIQEHLPNNTIIPTSILKGEGLDVLENTLREMFFTGDVKITDDVMVTNVRHRDLLIKARQNMVEALESLDLRLPLDVIEVDIKDCWTHLGEINGDTASEDILDTIFENFCIGK